MSTVEFFGHATYLLLATSYMVRDMFWLRAISIPASICSILFNYLAPTEPLWLIINWNLIFVTLNTIQLWRIHRDSRGVQLSDELAEFAALASPRLTATQAVWLFQRGRREHIVGPQSLLEEGQGAEDLILVMKGEVHISHDGNMLGECGAGTFLGEISFLTDEPHTASAFVNAGEEATILRWNQISLKTFAKSRPSFYVALQQYLATNLSRKFTRRETLTVA